MSDFRDRTHANICMYMYICFVSISLNEIVKFLFKKIFQIFTYSDVKQRATFVVLVYRIRFLKIFHNLIPQGSLFQQITLHFCFFATLSGIRIM